MYQSTERPLYRGCMYCRTHAITAARQDTGQDPRIGMPGEIVTTCEKGAPPFSVLHLVSHPLCYNMWGNLKLLQLQRDNACYCIVESRVSDTYLRYWRMKHSVNKERRSSVSRYNMVGFVPTNILLHRRHVSKSVVSTSRSMHNTGGIIIIVPSTPEVLVLSS